MNRPVPPDNAWGAAARDWAEVQEGQLRPLFAAVLAQTGVTAGSAVLDVACGTGLFCTLAVQLGATAAGIDASAGQLEVARLRLPQAEFREADMTSLPFDDDSFDLVSCCNALQYATDPVRALSEMRRVARAGGTVAILTRSTNGPRASELYAAALEPLRPANAPTAAGGSIMRQPGALEGAFAKAGLAIYADEEIECDWHYPDLETALRGVLSYAPAVRAIRASGVEAVHAAVGAALAPYRTAEGAYLLPNRARFLLAHVV